MLKAEQQEAVRWMVEREASFPAGGILADDVGKGKTFIAAGLIKDAPLEPTLIVVTKATQMEWASVIRNVTKRFPYVITGSSNADNSRSYDIVLVTHAMFARHDTRPRAIMERAWGRVIVDEAHVIRNVDTVIHRTLTSLKAHAKWAMTATPMQNSERDLLALARFVGIKTDDVGMVRDMFVLRRTNDDDDMLDMQTVRLPLHVPAEKALYTEVHEQLQRVLDEERATSTLRGGTMTTMEHVMRCRQAATHPAIYHRSMANKPGLPVEEVLKHTRLAAASLLSTGKGGCEGGARSSSKLWYLYRDIEGHDEKALVFCNWIDEMDVIEDVLQSNAIDTVRYDGRMPAEERDEAVFRFRQPDGPRVMVIQVQCGACGLNLQTATRVYIMRPQWNPALEYQAIGRALRTGQTRRVIVRRLVAEDSVDDMMQERQRDKLVRITGVIGDDAMERKLCDAAVAPVRSDAKNDSGGECSGDSGGECFGDSGGSAPAPCLDLCT
jgi:SNF2 family DNA or RNA helicase